MFSSETIASLDVLGVSGRKLARRPIVDNEKTSNLNLWSYNPEYAALFAKKRRGRSVTATNRIKSATADDRLLFTKHFFNQFCGSKTKNDSLIQNTFGKQKVDSKSLIEIDSSFKRSCEDIYRMKPSSKVWQNNNYKYPTLNGTGKNKQSEHLKLATELTIQTSKLDVKEASTVVGSSQQRTRSAWPAFDKNILSRFMRNRYTREANEEFRQILPKPVEEQRQHVDSLSPDILARLSKMTTSTPVESTTAVTSCEYLGGGDDEEKDSIDNEVNVDDEDEEVPNDEAPSEDLNIEDDYEDQKIIIETNLIRTKILPRETKKDEDKNLVMKIYNSLHASQSVDKLELKRSKKRGESLFKKAATSVEMKPRTPIILNYDDEEDDVDFVFEYEYTDVIGDELRRILDRYDGASSAEAFFKQNMPMQEHYVDAVVKRAFLDDSNSSDGEENDEDDNDENENSEQEKAEAANAKKQQVASLARDSFLMLKRMLVKKKYVLATLKMEKDLANKRNRRRIAQQQQQQKSRPVTAVSPSLLGSSNEATKIGATYRPKTVNIIPIKQVVSEDTFYLEDDSLKNEEAKLSAKIPTDSLYEPFRLVSSAVGQQNWPYELDFDQQTQSGKSNKQLSPITRSASASIKCYTSKKLPVVVQQQQQQQQQQNSQIMPPRIVVNNAPSNSSRITATYSSLRRSVSAKLLKSSSKPLSKPNKSTKTDTDYFEQRKKCLQMNKEEQMRRITIIEPGRTVRSQSTMLTTPSQKKLDTQRMRILMTSKSAEAEKVEAEAEPSKFLHIPIATAVNLRSSTPTLRPKNTRTTNVVAATAATLALQHQEEIFALIHNSGKSNLVTKVDLSKSDSSNKEDYVPYFNQSIFPRSSSNEKRPKTSKV